MEIRAGIVGLGRIGHRFGRSETGEPLCHSEAYADLPGVSLVLGIDSDADARAAFVSRFPQAEVYASLGEVPESMRLDVVSVCSPTPLHAEGVEAALRWQVKVILCEKPLAPDAATAEQIAAACARQDCVLVTNYSRRWTPMLRLLRELVGPGGRLGTPIGASLRYNGGLRHNGTHWIDLLQALFGPIATARRTESVPEDDPDPAESVSFAWDNGFTAHLISVRGTGCSIGEGEIWGDRGLARYQDGGNRVSFQVARPSQWPGFKEFGEPEVLTQAGLSGHLLEAVREAVELVRQGAAPSCTGMDGIRALRVVEKAREQASLSRTK